jgi:DNA polymerase alpha subunit A
VSDPKDINPFPETDPDAPKDIPPLTVMSLSVRTVVNHKENKKEVVCATARIWSNSQSVFSLPRHLHTNHYVFFSRL